MADRNLNLAMRVTADATAGIATFTQLKKGAIETKEAFDGATEKVAELARKIKDAEQPSAALTKEFASAKRAAAELKERFVENREALELSRRSLTAAGVDVKNLASEYRRLGLESKTAADAQKQASAAAASAAALAQVGAASRGQTKQERLSGIGDAISNNASSSLGLLGQRSEAQIQKELLGVQQAMQKLAADAKVTGSEFDRAFSAGQKRVAALKAEMSGGVDPFTASVARATGGVSDLRTKLAPLAAAFAAVTASIGVTEIVNIADAYAQMIARLKLATQYTGDFEQVQVLLKSAAKDSRAPLLDMVNLYSSMSPALQKLGKDAAQSTEIITTITKAVGISGVASASAKAAIVQLGQGFASGTLRGEELNSVLEQVPGLSRAIAAGLGVDTDALKHMGAEGVLTSVRIIEALEKVASQVDADFQALPPTVEQSMQRISDEFMQFVGGIDNSIGATAGLSAGLIGLADNIDTVAQIAIPALAAAAAIMVARLGLMTAAAVKAAVALAATNPIAAAAGVAAATAAYYALNKVLDDVAENAGKVDVEKTASDTKRAANARLKVEKDLAREIQKLENLRKVAAGKANADILLDDQQLQKKRIEEAKKATQEELKGVESLRGALQGAWQAAIDGARKAREEAAALLTQAADARLSGTDKANARRNQGLSDEEKSAIAERDAASARDAAASAAARAVIAGYEGDLKGAEKLALEAAKQAERAETFASAITDDNTAANLLEELGAIRAQALETRARLKEQEAKSSEDTARSMQEQILAAEERIKSLKAELAKPVTIQLDITAAEAQIARLKAQLDKPNGGSGATAQPSQGDVRRVDNASTEEADKTATITADTAAADAALQETAAAVDAIPSEKTVVIKTVSEGGSSSFSDAASAWNSTQGFKSGGHIRGPGTATSDSILARLSDGEYVVRAAAVRRYGLGFLHALNGMALPKFATGGLVSSAMAPALAESSGSGLVPANLHVPGMGAYPIMTTQDVQSEMLKMFRKSALSAGGRR